MIIGFNYWLVAAVLTLNAVLTLSTILPQPQHAEIQTKFRPPVNPVNLTKSDTPLTTGKHDGTKIGHQLMIWISGTYLIVIILRFSDITI